MILRLEAGSTNTPLRCACCGEKSETAHGFVYKDNDAYAVYYAGWSVGHLERGVSLAIAVGEWDENSQVSDRASFGIAVTGTSSSFDFTILDAKESPWSDTPLLGKMLNRGEARNHLEAGNAISVAEHIVREDVRVRRFLDLT
jgi:hypothetical protein